MKTEAVKLANTRVGDLIKLNDRFAEVEATGDYKRVGGMCSVNGTIVERVITENWLVRLKRKLVG